MNEPNKYFRLLNPDEIVREGDEFLNRGLHKWRPATFIGSAAGSEHYASNIHRRPVQVDEWIECAKQFPSEADANKNGLVHVYCPASPHIVSAHWENVCSNYPTDATHWRRITPPQSLVKRVEVREAGGMTREVIPQPDGSLKVGCVTIAAKDFDGIVRQRADAIAKCQS